MALVKTLTSKSKRTKCSCCGDVIPTGMVFSKIEGDNYCHIGDRPCNVHFMPLNHNIEVAPTPIDREQQAEQEREIFAAYKANGVSTATYFRDKDARS